MVMNVFRCFENSVYIITHYMCICAYVHEVCGHSVAIDACVLTCLCLCAFVFA